ncbi:3-hydroxyanthranilate 3,4-dioxygenase-like [Ptychodera flava]|uniref:3-hydroxyanthranilate 3,4-dioxygenase-like n=1 Tax=Ptychodera flava TaxID=63121 RepID=UPI00396AA9F6
MTADVVIYNKEKWLKENQQHFLPPVCNKMMHDAGQMKSFFVGGPNVRKDYHIEEGEELFFMVKGDMCLKIVEQGKNVDVPIKEGEIFLLPARIPHSPQRQKDTIGLVLERERSEDELDGLRYYVDGTLDSLYEKWFHCVDLGTQLAPIIKGFFASEQYKTGKPILEELPEKPPMDIDTKTTVEQPFVLKDWIDKNREEINSKGSKSLFDDHYQFSVIMYGPGEETFSSDQAEVLLWQLEGEMELVVGKEKKKKYEIKKDDLILVPQGWTYTAKRSSGSLCLVCYQDPSKKKAKKTEQS